MLLIPVSPASGKEPPDYLQTSDEKRKGGRLKHGRKGRKMVGRREGKKGGREREREGGHKKKEERKELSFNPDSAKCDELQSFNPPSPTFTHIPNGAVILLLLTSWAGSS